MRIKTLYENAGVRMCVSRREYDRRDPESGKNDSQGNHRCKRRRPDRARSASAASEGRKPSCPRRWWRRRTCSRQRRRRLLRSTRGRPGCSRRRPSGSGRRTRPSGHERPYKGSHVRYASRSSRSRHRSCARRLLLRWSFVRTLVIIFDAASHRSRYLASVLSLSSGGSNIGGTFKRLRWRQLFRQIVRLSCCNDDDDDDAQTVVALLSPTLAVNWLEFVEIWQDPDFFYF